MKNVILLPLVALITDYITVFQFVSRWFISRVAVKNRRKPTAAASPAVHRHEARGFHSVCVDELCVCVL